MVGLDDLRSVFQPMILRHYDSILYSSVIVSVGQGAMILN